MSAVTTDTKELENSRVRVSVEVPSDAVERELAGAAGEIGRDMKVPGFRKGKVPAQVVLQQVGRQAVLDEAVRRALPGWYEDAVQEAGLAVVGSPDLDITDLPEKGDSLSFSFEVGVRPTAKLGEYKGVEAPRRDAEVAEEDVQAELERLRESLASLETVEREAASGDYVVIDFVGSVDGEPFEGGDARGFLLELGSGRLIEGFESQLEGAKAGDEREVEVTFPDEYQAEHLAGKDASFAVSVKEVKAKRLPDLDDDLAVEAGGYDSVDELTEDIRTRLREGHEEEIEREYREAAVDAVAAAATVEVPHDLIHAKAHEMWHVTARRLQAQGLDPQQYLQFTNKTEEELVTESEPEAEAALRREAALAAVVEAEGIEVTDDEMMETLREASTQPGGKEPSEKALRRSLEKAKKRGQDDALREDIAMRKAVDMIVEHAKPIPIEQAKAREELWTPEKDKEEPKEIWTPE
jgi:trigger factor